MIEKVIDIAIGAGVILMQYFKGDFDVDYKDKAETDLVTTADFKSQEYILKRLKEEFPDDQFIAEEGVSDSVDYSGNVWFVDPLDATRRFVNKEECFGISIGLCINGVPSLGVVYAPARYIVYFAEKGKGAFIRENNKTKKIHISDVKNISDSTITLSNTKKRTKFLEQSANSLPVKKKIFEGSTVLRICMVATGESDISLPPFTDCCKWDTCGAQVILEEAGGRITDVYGNPLNYRQDDKNWDKSFVVTNNFLHDAVVKHINKFLPKEENN